MPSRTSMLPRTSECLQCERMLLRISRPHPASGYSDWTHLKTDPITGDFDTNKRLPGIDRYDHDPEPKCEEEPDARRAANGN